MAASPDRIINSNALLEIKCPFKGYIDIEPAQYYWDQVQHQMEVCDLNVGYLWECAFKLFEDSSVICSSSIGGLIIV